MSAEHDRDEGSGRRKKVVSVGRRNKMDVNPNSAANGSLTDVGKLLKERRSAKAAEKEDKEEKEKNERLEKERQKEREKEQKKKEKKEKKEREKKEKEGLKEKKKEDKEKRKGKKVNFFSLTKKNNSVIVQGDPSSDPSDGSPRSPKNLPADVPPSKKSTIVHDNPPQSEPSAGSSITEPVKKVASSTAAKRAMFMNNEMMGISVPVLNPHKSSTGANPAASNAQLVTFINGFNPFASTNGQKLPSAMAAHREPVPVKRQTSHQSGLDDAANKKKAGFAAALLEPDTRPTVQRSNLSQHLEKLSSVKDFSAFKANQTAALLRSDKVSQLNALRHDKKWISQMINKNMEETKKKEAASDSVETSLNMNFDRFADSLAPVEKPKEGKIADTYDQAQIQNQGDVLVQALNKNAGGVKVPKWLRNAVDTVDPVEAKIAKNKKREKEKERANRTAIDPILFANPNIAVDAEYETLFGECSMEESGVYIWRIEYLFPAEVVREPGEGITLCSNDCYVILHIGGDDEQGKEGKKLTIYNWIGEGATFDKVACSAIRARELNIYLRSKAMIKREEEIRESDEFLSLFEYNVDYQPNGTEPSARTTGRLMITRNGADEPGIKEMWVLGDKPDEWWLGGGEIKGRIYRITKHKACGKKDMIYEMREITFEWPGQFNQRDVFIVDMSGEDGMIWQWNGSLSDAPIRWRGREIAQRILKFERSLRACTVEIMESQEDLRFVKTTPGGVAVQAKPGQRGKCFFDYFEKPPAEVDGPLPETGVELDDDLMLSRLNIMPEKNEFKTLRVRGDAPPSKRFLATGMTFVLQTGNEIFVYINKLPVFEKTEIGRERRKLYITSKNRRRDGNMATMLANTIAKKLRTKNPNMGQVQTIYQGSEPVSFICKFPDWQRLVFVPYHSNYASAHIRFDRISRCSSTAVMEQAIEAAKQVILSPPEAIAEEELPDDATGSVEVWAIEDGKPTFKKLPPEERGQFYTRDCYLILYTYYDKTDKMKQRYICYFWEGRLSKSARFWTAFLFGFYPVLEKRIKTKGGKPPLNVRVQEHREPRHFANLFDGHVIVYSGSRKKPPTLRTVPPPELFHVKRTHKWLCHTMQVPCDSKQLNSQDSFICRTDKKVYVWYGKLLKFEDSAVVEEVREKIAKTREVAAVMDEGSELPEFWNLLGGFTPYECNEEFLNKYYEVRFGVQKRPRLFEFRSNTELKGTGIQTIEIFEFFQTVLVETQVYLLDTLINGEVFLWIGRRSSDSLSLQVKKLLRSLAQTTHYTRLDTIESGKEPIAFTRFFHTWVKMDVSEDPLDYMLERRADMMFTKYKQEEYERHRALYKPKPNKKTLYRVDWVQVIIREMPELLIPECRPEFNRGGEGEGGAVNSDEEDSSGEDIMLSQIRRPEKRKEEEEAWEEDEDETFEFSEKPEEEKGEEKSGVDKVGEAESFYMQRLAEKREEERQRVLEMELIALGFGAGASGYK
eukprot:TRINITY_DN25643_c0_g1_i1.p1 TRINITY_DN25643_c0_g1~~TRINITY_DN25643_c0_g1_i1.p1  ORF type:complete len:1471 (-),score=465.66 TRINITY_DN25643_c0_g1_i1:120-4532(-)